MKLTLEKLDETFWREDPPPPPAGPRVYWLDLETTGLDPASDQVLEVAVAEAFLGDCLTIARRYHQVVYWSRRYLSPATGLLTPFVRSMHEASGLLDECDASRVTLANVEWDLLNFVAPTADGEEAPVLAGSSVHFDRGFLKAHMPTLAARFQHRLLDISAVQLFCRSLGMPPLKKALAHRAEADVEESMSFYSACRGWLRGEFGRDADLERVLQDLHVVCAERDETSSRAEALAFALKQCHWW